VKPLLNSDGGGALLTVVIVYGFLGGLALVATLAFGQDLQDRTLPLLLSQPLSRSRIWNQKMILITAAVFAATLIELVLLAAVSGWYSGDEIRHAIGTFRSDEVFIAGMFLLATVCSCGFWTLFARSTIGGLVFNVASQFIAAVSVALLWGKFRGYDEPFQEPWTFVLVGAAGFLYSGAFLWAGARKFRRLEVRGDRLGEGDPFGFGAGRGRIWFRLLASRPTRPALNFIKKELLLQKTVAQFSMLFVLCWFAVMLLQWLGPVQHLTFLYDVLACVYAPVASLLAGCISLGEERALGLTSPQRALPFAPALQWLLKLGSSAATAVVLGFSLPLVLVILTNRLGLANESGLASAGNSAVLGFAAISTIMFVLGYWAIHLAGNTLKAALFAIAFVVLLNALTFTGIYLGTFAFGSDSPRPNERQIIFVVLRDTSIAAGVIMLGQSFIRFRMAEERRGMFLYPFTLAAAIFAISFLLTRYG
jgi:hypothetical protein